MRSPLITVENKNNAGFAFRIKGKAFQEGYLFLSPDMTYLFPFKDELSSVLFEDEGGQQHAAIYHKNRGYMVCLSFGEWWQKYGLADNDLLSIEVVNLAKRQYRIKRVINKPSPVKTAIENTNIVIKAGTDTAIAYAPANLDLLKKLVRHDFSPFAETNLTLKSERLNLRGDFTELISLKSCFGVIPYEHQIQTVRTVLTRMNGRALLADEVGLGKTIEAGLILKEYLLRGMVKKVLILTPASLITQWQQELRMKFDLPFKNHQEITEWDKADLVIASLDTAKSQKNQKHVQRINYDLLIIDEAHKLKNKKTQNWKFVNSVKTKYLLMLTATPIQNDLIELFNLISILKPGYLSTTSKFKSEFLAERDKRLPKNPARLKEILAEIMIRNRRSDTLINFPQRFVHTHHVGLNDDEVKLYAQLTEFIRQRYFTLPTHKNPRGINRLTLILLQKLMGSSTHALRRALEKMIASNFYKDDFDTNLRNLLEMARNIKSSKKAEVLLDLVKTVNEKIIIFTQFRGTQDYLWKLLEKEGYPCAIFHGQLSQAQKDRAIEEFRGDKPILISTESGGEGRNLQFCKMMMNFDLPWNPMRVEQRIGRIHRLGQTSDVHIINLSAENTIESYVLELLDKKINLFRLIIGELEMILGNMRTKRSLEQIIIDIVTTSQNNEAMKRKFASLGNKLERALKAHSDINKAHEEIFDGN